MSIKEAHCNLTFRKYQKDMLTVFEKQRKKKDRKFHLVAPPGSGKTIIGLELMRRLGKQAVVFSPNQAIQSGWLSQIKLFSFDITGSADPDSDADLISLSYQSITVKKAGTDELHKNAKELLKKLSSRETVILDECHHLTEHWANVLIENIQPHQYIIALTATPPRNSSQGEWQNYIKLVGEIDYEIILPPIIKEGFLAPYQDLVYLVSPSAEEVEMIRHLCEPFQRVMEKLKNSTEILPIHFWAEELLANYCDRDNKPIPFDEALKENFDLLVALVRFVKKHLGDLPPAVFLVQDMDEALTFEDVKLVIEEYVIRYLGKDRKHTELYNELKNALKEIGYRLTRKSLGAIPGGIKGIISLSESKMAALEPLLQQEMLYMQDELRVLILTDYQTRGDREGTSATEVMRFITSHSEIDPIDPVLVTGTSVLVDDDLAEVFTDFMKSYFQEHELDCSVELGSQDGFFEIMGTGPDWNTRNYVASITQMLEQGLTRCLISTRNLLGEGWNCERLNTLIDLTVVTSYAFVNQIRGRSIRLDPDKPFKTANNWDVTAILDNPIEGSYDIKRVQRKYRNFYGLSEDNVIEAGIGHVHPLLTVDDTPLLLKHLEPLNSDMLERSTNRLEVYKRWAIGEKYSGVFSNCLEILPLKESEKQILPPTERLMYRKLHLTVILGKITRFIGNTGWLALIYLMMRSDMEFTPLYFPVVLIMIILFMKKGTLFWSPLMRFLATRKITKGITLKRKLLLYSKILLYGFKELKLIEKHLGPKHIKLFIRKDGRYRLYLNQSEKAHFFTMAFEQLLAPVQDQRYFICEEKMNRNQLKEKWKKTKEAYLKGKYPNTINLSENTIVYPIPVEFSRNKKGRQIFLKYWNQFIYPGKILKSDSIGKEHFRKRPLPVILKKKVIWF